MDFLQILLIAVAVSMDAFAAAICKGLKAGRIVWRDVALIGLFFGLFQGLMPVIGWFLGSQFERYIIAFDHWIAFALLMFIGGKMIYEAVKNETCPPYTRSSVKEIILLAIATSIDALAVGVTFALVKTPITLAAVTFTLTTGLISALGVLVGVKFGERFKKPAEITGGVILVLIALKIVLEHTSLWL